MANTFLAGGRPQHAEENLAALNGHLQTDSHLAAHLASRFHLSLPTARLSSHALLALNNYTSSVKGANGGKDGSAAAATEELASRLLARLGARSEDQAVVFLYVTLAATCNCVLTVP
ncbi:hypothetical protein MRB53_040972 [Persea americana]|nr:hypothetical protein MRB53_040972 [Persea americana]